MKFGSKIGPGVILPGLILSLGAVALLSLSLGAMDFRPGMVFQGIFRYDSRIYEHAVVRTLRIPRTLMGILAGAALAVSGTAMQAVTRNPLASPGLLGVNAGAAFSIVVSVSLLNISAVPVLVAFSFLGGAFSAVLVYGVASGGRGGSPSVKLALAGVIVAALLSSLTSGILLFDQAALDVVRFWLTGSISGRDMNIQMQVLPFQLLSVLLLVLSGHHLNIISIGEERARSLGMSTGTVRLFILGLVVMAAGSTVAIAGPISFVGLAVPHMVRPFARGDYRRILLYSLLAGPVLTLSGDIIGRLIIRPAELQVGIITALFGAPFLILLVRRHGEVAL